MAAGRARMTSLEIINSQRAAAGQPKVGAPVPTRSVTVTVPGLSSDTVTQSE